MFSYRRHLESIDANTTPPFAALLHTVSLVLDLLSSKSPIIVPDASPPETPLVVEPLVRDVPRKVDTVSIPV